ncbi:MAG: DciA family protein [Vicinamibacterales bacterium]
MESLDRTAARALRTLLEAQPLTAAKVEFAWKIAAGPALARSASVSWSEDGRLAVRAKSEEWRHEIVRARPMILQRMAGLLGTGAVRSLIVLRVDPHD